MTSFLKKVFGLLALAAAANSGLVGVASQAGADDGNKDAVKACQKDGFVNYSTTSGVRFANQGACVSYVAQGGALVPLPDLRLVVTCTPVSFGVSCSFSVLNVGIGAATGTVEVHAELQLTGGNTDPSAGAESDARTCTSNPNTSTSTAVDPPAGTASASASASCTGTFPPGTTVLPIRVGVETSTGINGAHVAVNASVDPGNTIVESNEANNSFSQTYTT